MTHSQVATSAHRVSSGSGTMLPVPTHQPIGGFVAFFLAGPGAMALALGSCYALMKIGSGGSTTLWASGLATCVVAYLGALGAALWAAQVRTEWGAEG